MELRPIPARATPPSDEVVVSAIRDEIRERGPMTFARFMDIALYDPERGYYRAEAARPGRAGDFLTAPETHPIFGRAVARFAQSVHRGLGAPTTFTIRELGAGGGALAAPLVEALADRSSAPVADPADPAPTTIRYLVDEVEPRRVDAVRQRLAALALPPGVTVETAVDDGRPIDGLAIANEVLDALPTHRVMQRRDRLRELFVGLDDTGDLTDVEGDPSTPQLAARLEADEVRLADGQRAEICLALDGWVARAAAGLHNGILLLIDYGHPAAALYDPRRRAAGTLATYQGHTVDEDPYRSIGRQDLTAHVDFTAVDAAATAAGLRLVGSTMQAAFLDDLGLGDLLVAEQRRSAATLQSYLEARSAVVRMIDPAAMGRFWVVAYGAGTLAGARGALPGFASTTAARGTDRAARPARAGDARDD
ncbi:MAG TPA: SAM-dependent methyltransferase [Candidatus Limnocylindrales bacterium]